jgi:RNA polymerase sigma-70 factor (ECF subfamily)
MKPSFADLEDSALINLALAGQPECFAILMDRYLVSVRGLIRSRVQNAAEADDVLQQVLLKAWHHLSTFRSESSFRTWVTSVAINEARQSYRRERSRPLSHAFGDLNALVSQTESPDEALARLEAARMVRRAVAELPSKYRLVVNLCYLQQLSLREAAQWLQLTVQAVKSRLLRARTMLSAQIERPVPRYSASVETLKKPRVTKLNERAAA